MQYIASYYLCSFIWLCSQLFICAAVRFFNIEYFSFASLISRKDGSFLFSITLGNEDKTALRSSFDHLILIVLPLLKGDTEI